jgi:predicted unusual protein kinase regulating ubiquinone biosynthesis (AarF/ABC1/UbiB family)
MIPIHLTALMQVKRAIQLRNIMTSLGPAYIKLGQALSIRPDLLSPAAMNELQKLCDKVNDISMLRAASQHSQKIGAPAERHWHISSCCMRSASMQLCIKHAQPF